MAQSNYIPLAIFGAVGLGLYAYYKHLQQTCHPADSSGACGLYNSVFGAPVAAIQPADKPTSPAKPADTSAVDAIAKTQADLLAKTQAGAFGPQGSSALIGPALNLRNSLVAAWLGPKGWDINANPILAVSDWDAFMTGYISPSAKPVGGSQQVSADDYVKLRVTGTLGLNAISRPFIASRVPLGLVHRRGY